ncbi:unnamed protein product [Candidula unifasciata]|uniref:G-protein coupled receptors family 1 profile domain-containing protein n=1 Tax=Candidula unifasciata TaxID=100452 RepID=A0A8S4A0X0_9EUPU|nr:unnamed protein product [Candidula unifasciata]
MDLWNKTNNLMAVFLSTDRNPNTNYVLTKTNSSEAVLFYFVTYISTAINLILSSLGATANIINIIVYWRLGISESVNASFISLAVWTLISCCLSCLSEIIQAVDKFAPLADVNLLSLQYVYLGNTKAFFYVMMTFVTVYLSAERCICIIFPLKVKEIFTSRRVIIANTVVVLFGISCFTPAWATQGVQWTFDVGTNRTRLDIWVSDNRRDVELFVDACNGMALPVLAQILILVCTGFMLQGISDSTKFRQRYTKKETPRRGLNSREDVCPAEIKANIIKRTTIMSGKDLKLTKIVVLLAMIFFVCNLPVFISSFLRALITEIRVNKQHNKLHALLYSLVLEFGVINCTVNILVYYNVSSRYRHEFLMLFSRSGFTRDHNLH